MIYLSGVTNDRDEPTLIASGVGLIIQPGNSYYLRTQRYPYWAADNGCFNPATYIGHDAWLRWLDALERTKCLFAVAPDVSRRTDGELGGDPVATWALFEEFQPLLAELGFPAALAAQDGIEKMPNVAEQLEALDVLFIAGSTEWKLGPAAAELAQAARNLGKWVHMGRVNSLQRLRTAMEMGCNSADGTSLKYRLRASGAGDPAKRGAQEYSGWYQALDHQPSFLTFESPSLSVHRDAIEHRRTVDHRSVVPISRCSPSKESP